MVNVLKLCSALTNIGYRRKIFIFHVIWEVCEPRPKIVCGCANYWNLFPMVQWGTLIDTASSPWLFHWRTTISHWTGFHHQSCSTLYREIFGSYSAVKMFAESFHSQSRSNRWEKVGHVPDVFGFCFKPSCINFQNAISSSRQLKTSCLVVLALDKRPRYDL